MRVWSGSVGRARVTSSISAASRVWTPPSCR